MVIGKVTTPFTKEAAMSFIAGIISQVQSADLDEFERKMKEQKAAEAALVAERKAKGLLTLNELVQQMYGEDEVALKLGLPKPEPKPEVATEEKEEKGNGPVVERFPPPPIRRG